MAEPRRAISNDDGPACRVFGDDALNPDKVVLMEGRAAAAATAGLVERVSEGMPLIEEFGEW